MRFTLRRAARRGGRQRADRVVREMLRGNYAPFDEFFNRLPLSPEKKSDAL